MTPSASKSEKMAVTIPYESKSQLLILKEELHTSMSTIYKDALKAYIDQKRERWQKAADRMVDEYEANSELRDWVDIEEGFMMIRQSEKGNP